MYQRSVHRELGYFWRTFCCCIVVAQHFFWNVPRLFKLVPLCCFKTSRHHYILFEYFYCYFHGDCSVSHQVLPVPAKNTQKNSLLLDCYSLAVVSPCKFTSYARRQGYSTWEVHGGMGIKDTQRCLHNLFIAAKVYLTFDHNNKRICQNRNFPHAKQRSINELKWESSK